MTEANPRPAGTVRIGRTPDNDVILADLDISRHHALLRYHPDGSVELSDAGSHTGTFVNGQQITAVRLTEQDVVRIGKRRFRFSEGGLHELTDEERPALASAHEAVAAYWAAAEARDWAAFGALLADDVIYRGPQTREQVRGRDAYIRFNAEGFAYDWHLTVQRIVGEGQHAASWVDASQLAGAAADLHPTAAFDGLGGGFTGAAIRDALQAVADGHMSVPVGATVPLTRVNEAFGQISQRQVRGKIVLDTKN